MIMLSRHRHLPLVILGLVLLVTITACGGPEIPLTGTITDAYTGKPVPGAELVLGRSQMTADNNGQYRIPRWSVKDTLEISASGYEPVSIALTSEPNLAQPTPPAVTLDAKIRPNTLSGLIADAYTNSPLSGALVKASETISATTGTDGRYTLANLPESFTITIAVTDHETLSQNITKNTVFDTALRPTILSGRVTDRFSNQPVAGATVKAGSATTTTDAEGRYHLTDVPPEAEVEVSAKGYATVSQAIDKVTNLDAVLRPDVLQGTLIDSASGAPIKNATIIANTAPDSSDVAFVRIDNSSDGKFTLEGIPEQGFVEVLAPGYKKATIEIKPGNVPDTIKLEPFSARGLYVTAAVASSSELMKEYFDLIDKTELNTIVIDLKSDLRDDLGLVYYDSQVPMVKELGISADNMDIKGLLAEAKKRGIYTIARVQLFSHDNMLADARPDWAVKDLKTGEVYADYPGPGIRYAYLDPTNRNVWDYNIQLGIEAAHLGFDEINFDYIRFSDWYGDLSGYKERLGFSQPVDPVTNPDAMYKTITDFMEQAHRALNGAGAFMSVDIFGRVVLKGSMPIAQDITRMAPHTDYICPMPYPSLWWPGYLNFDNPTAHPYEVILESLRGALPLFEGKRAVLRSWLQDHTDPWQGSRVVKYGPKEVRAQIDAVRDLDPKLGWLLYNSANVYTDAALNPEP